MFLTVRDLATRLQIKPSTLYAWAAQHKVPCLKINGVVRFDSNEIPQWLDSCRGKAHDKKASSYPRHWPSKTGIEELVSQAKRAVYNASHGETRPTSSPKGKEARNGAR